MAGRVAGDWVKGAGRDPGVPVASRTAEEAARGQSAGSEQVCALLRSLLLLGGEWAQGQRTPEGHQAGAWVAAWARLVTTETVSRDRIQDIIWRKGCQDCRRRMVSLELVNIHLLSPCE